MLQYLTAIPFSFLLDLLLLFYLFIIIIIIVVVVVVVVIVGCPRTHSVDQADFKLTETHLLLPPSDGIKGVCLHAHPIFLFFFFFFLVLFFGAGDRTQGLALPR